MTRGGWQVQERKARQAAKASRISAPITISLSPAATTISKTDSPDIQPAISTTSALDPVPLVLPADCSPPTTPDTVTPTVTETTTPERPSTPKALISTLADGNSPPEIVAAAIAPSISSAPVNLAASIPLSPICASSFDAVVSTHADPSVLQHPASGKKLNKRAGRNFAEAAAAATATLELSLTSELSDASDDSALTHSTSIPPPTAERFQQVAATAEYLSKEMRRVSLHFPGIENCESYKERDAQQEQEEEDLESITAKITAFRRALETEAEAPSQKDDGLQPRTSQREKELQDAIIKADLRIADFQSHTAQAHEEFLSFLTHKLAKQEEASRNASHAAARIIALLIFCNCAFVGLLIAPYL